MTPARRVLLAAALLVPVGSTARSACAASLQAAPTLPLASTFASTQQTYYPGDNLVADFNGDGRPDVAVIVRDGGHLSYPVVFAYLGTPTGFASPATTTLVGTVSGAGDATAADFNGDGRMDIALTTSLGGINVLLSEGTGTFAYTGPLGSGYVFAGIAAADFNRDGRLDLASVQVMKTAATRIWLHLAHPAGGFMAPRITPIAVAGYPWSAASGDLNGDGGPDLVITEYTSVRVILGDGNGNFTSATSFPTAGLGALAVAVDDFDEDGHPDVVTADSQSETLSLLLGNGLGGLGAPQAVPGPALASHVVIADFDADGHRDVAASGQGTFVYRGDGQGHLGTPRTFGVEGDLATGDLNLDGRLDLVALQSVLFGDGTGDFAAQRFHRVGRTPRDLAAGDLNGDGRADLVTANAGSGSVSVLLGAKDGTFAPPTSFFTTPIPTSIGVGDVDGDGRRDVVTASDSGQALSVLRGDGLGGLLPPVSQVLPGRARALAVGDLDLDGRADVAVATENGLVSVWLAGANGALIAGATYSLPTLPDAITAGSLNADFRPDLAVTREGGGVTVLLGTGAGAFVQSDQAIRPNWRAYRVLAAPLQGDGSVDLAVCGDLWLRTLDILVGDGTGRFTPTEDPGLADWSGGARGLAVANLDQDGHPDLAVASTKLFTVESDAKGHLGREREGIAMGGTASALVSADFDGDGRDDLAAAVQQGHGVTVFLARSPAMSADVEVAMVSSPDVAPPNATVTHQVTVTNHGPQDAQAVSVTVEIGSGLEYVSSSPGKPPCALVNLIGFAPILHCPLGDLAAGAIREITIQTRVGFNNSSYPQRATVVSGGPHDPDLGNNVATSIVHSLPIDIAITVADTVDPVAPGGVFAYVITLTNVGDATSSFGLVTDRLPAGVTFLSSSPASCWLPEPNVVNCESPGIVPGGSHVITLNVQAQSFTTVENVVGADFIYDANDTNDVAVEQTSMSLGISRELGHGASRLEDLGAPTPGEDRFYIWEAPRSSYEVVVDATAGDAGTTIQLDRLSALVSQVQSAQPVGTGAARSLRWANTGAAETVEVIRVRSAACSTACDVDDAYRIRTYETTGRVARFNNTGTQATVLILANPTDAAVQGTVWCWSPSGELLASRPFGVGGRRSTALAVSGFLPGFSGSITVTHDAPYGALVGKSVTLEPATGFSFDTPLTVRSR